MNLIVDAMSLLFRAFYALPPLTTSTGEPSGALYGVASLLVKILREHQPTAIAFADDVGPTFRHRAWSAYKQHRAAAPDPLRAQILRLRALLDAWDVPRHAAPDHEADDVLASLARALAPAPVLVVTGDTDLLQIADGATRVLFVGRRGADAVLYDADAVRARYGIEPARIPTWKALVGDASDGLPGVPGVGAKTASALVGRFGSADGILAHADAIPAKVRPAIVGNADSARLWEDLATLRRDLPLSEPLVAPIDDASRARLRAELDALEFRSLLKRL